MFRAIGFLILFVPPTTVFALITVQFITGLPIPPSIEALVFPLGVLLLALYSLRIRLSPVDARHFVELSKGARFAATIVVFVSCAVVFLPVFFGNLFLGAGLATASIGAFWMPSALAAGPYTRLLLTGEVKLSEKQMLGTRNGGIAMLFLAWFLGNRKFLDEMSPNILSTVVFIPFHFMGWLFISQAGGFPYSLIGGTMVILVPLASRQVIERNLSKDDLAKVSEMLSEQQFRFDR